MLESGEEKNFKDHVEKAGCVILKLNPLGLCGIPDRLILGLKCFVLFVEMKRKYGTPSVIQDWFHKTLRRYGFEPIITYGADEAKTEFDKRYKAHLKTHGLL
jgi:hypothetical protein